MRMLLAMLLFGLSSAAAACGLEAGGSTSVTLYYERGESGISSRTSETLDFFTANLKGCRVIVVVSGHRDLSEGGGLAGVSQARADGVRKRLQELGYAPLDILVRDMASERPYQATPPGASEPLNRRVELTVVSL